MNINNLIINRVNLRFNEDRDCYLNISKAGDFVHVGGSAEWTKGKLPAASHGQFESWLRGQGIEDDGTFLRFDFSTEKEDDDVFSVMLDISSIKPFKDKIFQQELGRFFIERGFWLEPLRVAVSFSIYQHQGDFSPEWEQYRRIDFKWNKKREELSLNIGSEKILISRQMQDPINKARIVNEENQLIYRAFDDSTPRKVFNTDYIDKGTPKKFNYHGRYEDLKKILFEYLNTFQSRFFTIDKSGLKNVEPSDVQKIFSRQ
ncbi:hypothetical protein MJD09_28200, partial [bacterium]|nr:hypothetical protein [bacterium]